MKSELKKKYLREIPLHLMILPGILLVIIYSYVPMLGLGIAFQDFIPSKGFFGSKWIGLENIKYVLEMPGIFRIIWNTLYIANMKIILGIIVPVIFALLLNEIHKGGIKRSIQTIVYLPYFLSWVILGGIFIDLLSPQTGFVNDMIKAVGLKPIFFLGDNHWFPFTLVITNTWKDFGFNTIIYLAALTGIDPTLYEACTVDGGNRWKQTLYITLPSLLPYIILMSCLSLGNILNAGFEQVFVLYSPSVYESGDIIDTLVYRLGFIDAQFGVATVVGLFKSVVSFVMMVLSYKLAYKYSGYKIF